jgi:divalent metal cation (Fe/Co/Zn/Cd) transporter
MTGADIDAVRHTGLERRARLLEYGTTVWNGAEAVVSITAGMTAHSLGLIAFGLDSCVEVFASLVVLWQLRPSPHRRARSLRAMRLIGIAFGVLGIYLGVDAVHGLIAAAQPKRSWLGLGFLAATAIVMWMLAYGKRITGRRLGNEPLVANASMTFLDGSLAAGILIAVYLAVRLGWWWTDSLAAGIVAVIALNEARRSWRGDVN